MENEKEDHMKDTVINKIKVQTLLPQPRYSIKDLEYFRDNRVSKFLRRNSVPEILEECKRRALIDHDYVLSVDNDVVSLTYLGVKYSIETNVKFDKLYLNEFSAYNEALERLDEATIFLESFLGQSDLHKTDYMEEIINDIFRYRGLVAYCLYLVCEKLASLDFVKREDLNKTGKLVRYISFEQLKQKTKYIFKDVKKTGIMFVFDDSDSDVLTGVGLACRYDISLSGIRYIPIKVIKSDVSEWFLDGFDFCGSVEEAIDFISNAHLEGTI